MAQLLRGAWLESVEREGLGPVVPAAPASDAGDEPPCPACGHAAALDADGTCAGCGLQLG